MPLSRQRQNRHGWYGPSPRANPLCSLHLSTLTVDCQRSYRESSAVAAARYTPEWAASGGRRFVMAVSETMIRVDELAKKLFDVITQFSLTIPRHRRRCDDLKE